MQQPRPHDLGRQGVRGGGLWDRDGDIVGGDDDASEGYPSALYPSELRLIVSDDLSEGYGGGSGGGGLVQARGSWLFICCGGFIFWQMSWLIPFPRPRLTTGIGAWSGLLRPDVSGDILVEAAGTRGPCVFPPGLIRQDLSQLRIQFSSFIHTNHQLFALPVTLRS